MQIIIDNNNKITIDSDGNIDSLTGSKAHNFYFALLRGARTQEKTLENQEKLALYALIQYAQKNWRVIYD